MKMLMVVCSGENLERMRKVFEEHGVRGFTEIPNTRGAGETGLHLGTRAFPGSSSVVFSVVPDDVVDPLASALQALSRDCEPAEGLAAFVMDADRIV